MNTEQYGPQKRDMTILIVEDELIVSSDIQQRVKSLGYKVSGTAVSGEEAVAQAVATRPDLILMDIWLNGTMDGITAAGQIRQHVDIPVVYLTAHADAATLERAKITGPFGYIFKPLEERDLQTTIEMALYRHAADRKLAESEQSLKEAQRIGKIGSWEFDVLTGQVIWSDELYRLFERAPADGPPGFDEDLSLYYPDTVTLSKAVRTAIKRGEQIAIEQQVCLSGGRAAWHNVVINPVSDGSGRVVKLVGIVQDITEQKNSAEQIARLNRLYGMLSQTNKAIVRNTDQDALFREVCRVAVDYGGFTMAWVGLVDEKTRQVLQVAAFGNGTEYLDRVVITARNEPEGRGPTGTAIREGRCYICNDFMSDSHTILWREQAARQGFAASAALPLRLNGKAVGALTLYAGEQGYFNEPLVALLHELADDLSYALDNLDREQRRREAVAHLRTLSTVVEQSPVCISITDLGGNLTYINPAFTLLTGYEPEEVLGTSHRFLKSGGTPPETYRELWATISSGGVWQGEFLNKKKHGERYWEWAVIAPVKNEEGVISGYVAVKEDISRRKQREQELLTVEAISAALRTMLNQTEMLPVVFDRVSTFFQVESAALVMHNPAGGSSRVELASGAAARWSGCILSEGEEVIARVIATGEPFVDMSLTRGTRFNITENGFLLPAVACVPLITHEKILGAFFIARRSAVSQDELRLFNAIADMAAGAFHRASLHEKTELRLARISTLREIDIAISSTLDLRITLNILIEKIIAQLGVDAAGVLLLDPRTLTLTPAASRGRKTQEAIPQRLDGAYAGRAAREQHPVSLVSLEECTDSVALALKEEGFTSYHAIPLVSKGIVKGVLELYSRTTFAPDLELAYYLEAVALQTALAIENDKLFEDINRSNLELLLAYDTTIEGWSRALDLRDSATEGHSRRVMETTLRIARSVEIAEHELVHVRRGALLHDIGKMAMPDSILLKPGPLSADEWTIMRRHPEIARDLLSPIAFLRQALDIPLYHHEWWDGTGYPHGLRGKDIPLAARIFAVVDVWDATISPRPYRAAWSAEQVRENIRSLAGSHLDPQIVDLFLALEMEY